MRVRSGGSFDDAIDIRNYVVEVHISINSPIVGKSIVDLVKPSSGDVMVTQIIRNKISISPLPDFVLSENDIVLLEGSHTGIDSVMNSARLEFSKERTLSTGIRIVILILLKRSSRITRPLLALVRKSFHSLTTIMSICLR